MLAVISLIAESTHPSTISNPSSRIHTTQSSPLGTPTAQTLFMDGVLHIFSYLSFSELLPGLQSCHYWYSCGRRERGRDLTFSLNGPYHSRRSKFAQLLTSPFKFHVGAVKSLHIDLISTISRLSHPNLHTLTCYFDGMASRVNQWELQLPASFRLPKSLSTLKIDISWVCTSYDFCQAFLNLLPTGLNLTTIEFTCSTTAFSPDLSFLRALPKLTSLDVHHIQHDVVDSAPRLFASLPLTKLSWNGGHNQQPDWTIFEPQSPLMQHIQDLELIQWRPTQREWDHLARNRPPQLRTLTLHIDEPKRYSLRGLPSLRLTSLQLMIPPTETARDHPNYSRGLSALTKSSSLTHLSISRLFFADGEQLRQLLRSLQKLTHLHLTGHRPSWQYPLLVIPFELLPDVTILDYVLIDQFQSLIRYVVLNDRLVSLTIGQLDLQKEYSNENSNEKWTTLCQHHEQFMKRPFQLAINDINDHVLNFNFHHTNQTVASISTTRSVESDDHPVNAYTPEPPRVGVKDQDVPATSLVGVETNPGPFVQECTDAISISISHPPTARTLFVDGLLSIFCWLSLSDLLSAVHTCHYWYECGLKERCRLMEFSLKHHSSGNQPTQFWKLPNLIESPLRYHITNITDINICHLLDIKHLNHFPNLHTCSFHLQFRVWNSECRMINPREFIESNFQLPPSLRRFKIHLESRYSVCSVTADLCQSLINSLNQSSITEFDFNTDYEGRHYDLSPIGQAPQLTSLRLNLSTPLTKENQRLIASLSLRELVLNVPSQPEWRIIHPESPLIHSVHTWSWDDYSVTGGYHHLFHLSQHPPPNLTNLSHGLSNDPATVIDFTRFTQLSQLTLSNDQNHDALSSENEKTPDKYATILCRCHSITHLSLDGDIFNDTQLCRILIALQESLHTLIVLGDDELKPINEALGHLPPITKLTRIHLYSFDSFLSTLAHSGRAIKLSIESISLDMSDSAKFPLHQSEFNSVCHHRLSHSHMQPGFTLEMEVDCTPSKQFQFVYVHSITPIHPSHTSSLTHQPTTAHSTDVPAERLVGIETNPGPVVTTTTPHTPTARILFVDGLLSIFSYLSLIDVIPAFRSCHYWYSCGLKEKSRQLKVNASKRTGYLSDSSSSDKFFELDDTVEFVDLPQILNSPFSYHVTSLLYISIVRLSAMITGHCSVPSLEHIKKLEIYLTSRNSTLTVPAPIESSTTSVSTLTPVVVLPTAFISVESLHVHIFPSCTADTDLIQGLIHSIPLSGSPISDFKFINLTRQHFDLTPLICLSSTLTRVHIFSPRGFKPSDQKIYANLPLSHLTCGGLGKPDWSVLHPQSPLMNLEELNWFDWNPSESDWAHVTRYPPPRLHTLTIQLRDQLQLLTGLPALTPRLTSLSISRLANDINLAELSGDRYVHILTQCQSLTRLRLEPSILTDHQLSQILISLTNLDELTLLSHRTPVRYSRAWSHLPPNTIIHLLTMDELRDLLVHSVERVATVTIETLSTDQSISIDTMNESINALCEEHSRSRTRAFQLKIQKLNIRPFHFTYHKITPSIEPPAKLLIGIETNPGPFVTTITTTTPTAETLFVDGLLSIFSWLKLSDLLPALRSCHYWYSCGLKERCREISYEFKTGRTTRTLPELLRSPFKFHISRLVTPWIYQLSDLPELLFPNLKQLVCSFHGPSAPPTSSTGSNVSSIHSSSISTSITTIFTLPTSLTSLRINILPFYVSIDSCQTFLSAIAECQQLTEFNFRYHAVNSYEHQFNLESLLHLPKLTHSQLHLPATSDSNAYQLVVSRLPLTYLHWSGLSMLDWTILYPTSPLMIKVEELKLDDWNPTEHDWAHLTQHPPPKLHTLTLSLDRPSDISLSGISALNLTRFILSPRSWDDHDQEDYSSFIPHLQRLNHSLTHLTLDGSFFTDDQLSQLLNSLDQLIELELVDTTRTLGRVFQSLPQRCTIHHAVVETFTSFMSHLSQSERISSLEIWSMEFDQPDPSLELESSAEEFERMCRAYAQTMKHEFELEIRKINDRNVYLNYHHRVHSDPPTVAAAMPAPTTMIMTMTTTTVSVTAPATLLKDDICSYGYSN